MLDLPGRARHRASGCSATARSRAGLELVDSKTSTTGVVITTYKPAGEIDYGSFALEEPTAAEVERRRQLDAEEVA